MLKYIRMFILFIERDGSNNCVSIVDFNMFGGRFM